MHAQSILAALAVPALVYGAAIPQEFPENWDETSEDIVGGVTAAQGDVPFIVSVSLSGVGHYCGGSLINANTVVSAAHCYQGETATDFSVRAGSLNKNSGGTTSAVASIVIHPSYNSRTSDNDIAIIKLRTPIATSSTISYASLAASGQDPAAGTTLTVAGWGATTQGGGSPTTLRKVDVPVVARTTCRSRYSTIGLSVTDQMFCAGFTAGGKDSCQGDSGGPIITSSKQLVGIVSWGEGCAQPNFPGVYSRVGSLTSFISANL
ncbi:hypothetical protein HBI56_139780 [Parastagonospora nodorum]|uniref:Peptidase S1 domain-containing protein n=2 Tax=Phaeosphaeria nodorum (strain SN15 / ATCC MYA-4574 / FGSC 10173) TaxID=321614 RepID=A0A7U2NPG3_PHANO|nr:hypothetical protein SNOG_05978 [Parastagonospora nodorum SN15]KAH3911745.1 hypothetical protein HBH56_128010 [Parastagonospora nodorum]EAT87042.2 hypothetical protein SNOG_05978 [Parastagonospora nodorum SN15]KAH3931652.1 hypothetical protein HBH54_095470 [Parastagonospora nodorum]KAH3947350.1 hypothetical protein HBH53_118300 [Parastagonospora nodorum]KAH3970764.1 hypothetical protein HBH51_114730 [Parastagonospora nodorum]